jgi:predicted permease
MLNDLRYAWRSMRTNPWFTAIAVVTLALGIGANTAIFSVVNAVLLRPLPFRDPARLVTVFGTNPRLHVTNDVVSYPAYLDWQAQNHALAGIEAWAGWSFNLSAGDQPEQVPALRVTPGLFSLLGVAPALGRGFLPEERQPGRNHVLLLSHDLWVRCFASDPQILGRKVTITADTDAESYTVVGVMPAGFQFTGPWVQAWVPLLPDPNRGHGFITVVGRLKADAGIRQAQVEMDTISARLAKAYPRQMEGLGAHVVPLHQQMAGDLRAGLYVFLGAVAFVLLIACANVASLLLARAAARQRETAIRASLGASRSRLIRQFLTESLLLSLVGGAAGLVIGWWSVAGLVALLSNVHLQVHGVDQIRVDPVVLGFTLMLSLATGLVFGLAPAVHGSGADLNETLKEGGRTQAAGGQRARLRKLLVISELALSLVLLAGAGLLMRSFLLLERVTPGFRPEKLLTMLVHLPRSRYPELPKQVAFFDEALERIARIPGLRSVGVVNSLPMSGDQDSESFDIEGRPSPEGESQSAGDREINAAYFRTMGIPLLSGREFTWRDTAGAPKVVIINESMARRFWPGENPVGRRLSLEKKPPVWREIVGVVADIRHSGLAHDPAPEMYFPYPQSPASMYYSPVAHLYLVIRADGDPMALLNAVRAQILVIDRNQPVSYVKTMERLMADSVAPQRISLLLIGIFAGMALVLASAGIYGVVSYTASRRTHEIGVRIAMGARSSDVLKLVLGEGLRLVAAGVAVGLAGALALTRVLERVLYGVRPGDPLTLIAVSVVLAAVALAASYVPARRASKVDPVEALRYE